MTRKKDPDRPDAAEEPGGKVTEGPQEAAAPEGVTPEAAEGGRDERPESAEAVAEEPEASWPGSRIADESPGAEGPETAWEDAPRVLPATEQPAEPAEPGTHEEPTAAAAPEHHEEHHSIAGRVLTWLFFLVAGGALFLWAGPRVAPNLPSGLAPVAEWLTPGAAQQAAALEALRADLEQRLAEMRPGMAANEVEAQVAREVAAAAEVAAGERAAAEKALADRITALSDQVAAGDSREIEERLARAESQAAGLVAEFEALKRQLAGVAESGGQISEEQAARVAAFAASVEGLRGEFQSLAGRVGALQQRIDEVEAASRRREEAAAARAEEIAREAEARRRAAALEAALSDLGARLEAGEPFADLLDPVQELSGTEIPPALAEAGPKGIPTLAALRAMFPEAAHEAIRASIRAGSGDGVLGRASSFLEARIAMRSLEEREGGDTDAILSRVEARMAERRLDAALAEAEALPAEARAPLGPWMAAAGLREGAVRAYEELKAAAMGAK